MNLDSLKVRALMVHDVPRPEDDDPLLVTDAPVQLDDQLRAYFRRKVIASLTTRGIDVVADPTARPVVREAAQGILSDESAFAEESKKIGQHLYDIQTQRNSPGLVAIVLGESDDGPCVSVVKLEREQGLRVRLKTVEEQTVIDLEYLRDLTLTDKTKVFKTSILQFGDPADPQSMYGAVSDDQRGQEEGIGVAMFFLSTFLGCKLQASPEKATLEFFEATEEFINKDVADPAKKGEYQIALLATMQEKAIDLRPATFASRHIDAAHRPALLQRIQERELNPQASFQKETGLVRNKIRGFKLTFESGMTLVGKQEDLRERVELPGEDDPEPTVRITDAIKRIRGR